MRYPTISHVGGARRGLGKAVPSDSFTVEAIAQVGISMAAWDASST